MIDDDDDGNGVGDGGVGDDDYVKLWKIYE